MRKLGGASLRTDVYKVHRNSCVRLNPTDLAPISSRQSAEESSESDSEPEIVDHPTTETPVETTLFTPATASSRPQRVRKPPGWLEAYVRD